MPTRGVFRQIESKAADEPPVNAIEFDRGRQTFRGEFGPRPHKGGTIGRRRGFFSRADDQLRQRRPRVDVVEGGVQIILEFLPLAGSLWGELRFDELLLGFGCHRDERGIHGERGHEEGEKQHPQPRGLRSMSCATLKVCEGDCTGPGGGNGDQERGDVNVRIGNPNSDGRNHHSQKPSCNRHTSSRGPGCPPHAWQTRYAGCRPDCTRMKEDQTSGERDSGRHQGMQ